MPNRVVAIALVLAILAPAACSRPIVPTNDVAAAQTVAATATTVVADAQAVWPLVLATVPPADQAAAQTGFNSAVFDANHAILALDDTIAATVAIAGADGGVSVPNLTAAISDVAAAVAAVVAVVQNIHWSLSTVPASVAGDLTAHAARLRALAAPRSP